MTFMIDEKLGFEVPLSSVEQTVVQGKNELGFEFKQVSCCLPAAAPLCALVGD